ELEGALLVLLVEIAPPVREQPAQVEEPDPERDRRTPAQAGIAAPLLADLAGARRQGRTHLRAPPATGARRMRALTTTVSGCRPISAVTSLKRFDASHAETIALGSALSIFPVTSSDCASAI